MGNPMTKEEREHYLADRHVGMLSVERIGKAPLVAPIWYGYEAGGELWVMTPRRSAKHKLLERENRFSLCVQTESWPCRYVSVSGAVTSIEPRDETTVRSLVERYLPTSKVERFLEVIADVDYLIIRMRPEQWATSDVSKDDYLA